MCVCWCELILFAFDLLAFRMFLDISSSSYCLVIRFYNWMVSLNYWKHPKLIKKESNWLNRAYFLPNPKSLSSLQRADYILGVVYIQANIWTALHVCRYKTKNWFFLLTNTHIQAAWRHRSNILSPQLITQKCFSTRTLHVTQVKF